ncbi:hypothetical protein Q5M85_12265 [Paraclostridium bifermentans]|nr:hypothetical protein [Paraclostridium bifermentans]
MNASKVPRHVKVIDGKEVLVVDFGDTNRRYRVDYQTEITELKDSYKNTAEITWDGGKKMIHLQLHLSSLHLGKLI